MTPHRYVVHLRLQAALRLIRNGQMSMAEIAADTGFSDQSHLSRWIRRVQRGRTVRVHLIVFQNRRNLHEPALRLP